MKGALKSVGVLLLLGLIFPLVAAPTLIAWLVTWRKRVPPTGPTVLVTGGKMTKALHLVRAFARAGYRVILAETPKYRWSGHRFSRSVSRFVTWPVPEADPAAYAQTLCANCPVQTWPPPSRAWASPRTTLGFCRNASPVRSTAPTAPYGTGASGCTCVVPLPPSR